MTQTRRQSLIEAWSNILVGLGINLLANFALFPLFGWKISLKQNLVYAFFMTGISLVRSYALRRAFNRWHR